MMTKEQLNNIHDQMNEATHIREMHGTGLTRAQRRLKDRLIKKHVIKQINKNK